MALYQSEPKGIYIGNNGTPRLPSAYQEVEYLQSRDVGASWGYSYLAPYINTGFIPNEKSRVEWKMGGWTQQGSYQMFGVRQNWNNIGRGFAIVTDAYQFNGNAGVNHGMTDGNIHTGSFGQDGLYVDGDLKIVPATTTFTSPGNLYLFGLNNNGSFSEYSYLKYYYFKIYDNGTLVRDFIPCYRISDNKPGLYDLVNDVFYTNANTSYDSSYPFTVGNDVVPIDREIKHVYKVYMQVRPSIATWGDINTATSTHASSYIGGFQGLYINPEQNVALTVSYNNNTKGFAFTGKDISTASNTLGDRFLQNKTHCISANPSGTHIYIGTHSDDTIYEYETTGFNINNATLYKSININWDVQAMYITPDEKYLVVCNPDDQGLSSASTLLLFRMTTPGDVSTLSLVKTISDIFPYNCHGIFFDRNLRQCVACEYNPSSGKIYQYTCDLLNSDTFTPISSLGPIGFTVGYANITEDGTTMYASQESGYIQQYSLS